jgi:hypothetical protein
VSKAALCRFSVAADVIINVENNDVKIKLFSTQAPV